jgi:hypothetical protein
VNFALLEGALIQPGEVKQIQFGILRGDPRQNTWGKNARVRLQRVDQPGVTETRMNGPRYSGYLDRISKLIKEKWSYPCCEGRGDGPL